MVYTADGGLVAASPQITRDTLYTVQSGDKYYFSLKSDYYYKRTLSNVLGSCFSNNGYDIILMLPETLSEGDDYYNMQSEMEKSSADTYNYIFLSLASMLVLAMVSVYLIYAAGETAGPEKIKLSFLDKLPTDLHFVLAAAVAGGGSLRNFNLGSRLQTCFRLLCRRQSAYDVCGYVAYCRCGVGCAA